MEGWKNVGRVRHLYGIRGKGRVSIYHNIGPIKTGHELSDMLLVSSLEVSTVVESAEHDFVTDFEFEIFGSVLVGMICLVDFGLDEVVVHLSHVVGQSFDDLGHVQCHLSAIY